MYDNRKIHLDQSFNTRDLGGLVTIDGKQIKTKKLIRSDNTAYLSESDINILREYGVNTIIDIRSEKERFEEEDIMSTISDFNYFFIPLDCNDFAYYLSRNPNLLKLSLLDGYMSLLAQESIIKNIITQIESSLSNGGVLFHCSGGKDRTGLISMLILSILRVDRKAISDDYHMTYENLMRSEIIRNWVKKFGEEYVLCPPDLIQKTIDEICNQYKSVIDYLIHCGVSASTINSIQHQLLF